ncbi:hypothetical protein EDC01DRAFT_630610 [Geopyxis carbonaria]|nr:hypothetical protein EDC01DRAFT_630610 [Geopyxis carbonaria]
MTSRDLFQKTNTTLLEQLKTPKHSEAQRTKPNHQKQKMKTVGSTCAARNIELLNLIFENYTLLVVSYFKLKKPKPTDVRQWSLDRLREVYENYCNFLNKAKLDKLVTDCHKSVLLAVHKMMKSPMREFTQEEIEPVLNDMVVARDKLIREKIARNEAKEAAMEKLNMKRRIV